METRGKERKRLRVKVPAPGLDRIPALAPPRNLTFRALTPKSKEAAQLLPGFSGLFGWTWSSRL